MIDFKKHLACAYPMAFDTETWLIEPGILAPPMVCTTWAGVGESGHISLHNDEGLKDLYQEWLETSRYLLVGANMPYDMAVAAAKWPDLLPLIFNAYDQNRVTDVQTRQKLIDIANGELNGWRNASTGVWTKHGYSLADLTLRHLGEDRSHLKKGPDVWRLRYKELQDVPLEEWPQEALDYAIGDSVDTIGVWAKQEEDTQFLEDEFRQARAHWALHLMSCRGIMTDPKFVRIYEERILAEVEDAKSMIFDLGWLVPKSKKDPTLKRSMKKVHQYCEDNHPNINRTPTGKPKLDEESVKATKDPVLLAYQKYSSSKTIITKIDELWQGTSTPIQARFSVLMSSGRTSCSGPNIQARSRKFGDRECFIARPGYVFINADYDGLELRTAAQVAIWICGFSRMGDALNEGLDLHVLFASTIRGISYEQGMELYKKEKGLNFDSEDPDTFLFVRQLAKMGNFGFIAGQGAAGFVNHMIEKGNTVCGRPDHGKELKLTWNKELMCKNCLDGAETLRANWFVTWPEMVDMFAYVKSLIGKVGHANIRQFISNRHRGMVGYTETANGFSQGLGADATKAALYAISKACYVGDSHLRGSYPVDFIHDEFIAETPEEKGHDAAYEMTEIMISEANKWLPDVPTTGDPLIMRRWSKSAQPRFDDNGRLRPWDCDVTGKEI